MKNKKIDLKALFKSIMSIGCIVLLVWLIKYVIEVLW